MKILLDIKDNKAAFFMELLKNFNFVKAEPVKTEKAKTTKGDKEYKKEHAESIEFSSYAMGLHDDDDEPDISHLPVKEYNPTFNLNG